jgi:Tol biopolymer transport system component
MNNIRKYVTTILVLSLFFSLCASVAVAIPWPIPPMNEVHSLSGTYGDVRGTSSDLQFHMAVDMPASAGTEVYCIKSGYIIAVDGNIPPEWIQIGDTKTSTKGWSYSHMTNIPAKYLVVGTKVNYGDCIGEVMDFDISTNDDHLDFRLDSKDCTKAFVNPVEVLNPSPPEGETPVVDTISFRRQEEEAWFTRRVDGQVVIDDEVDIIARAYNHMGEIPSDFSSYSPGIYKIEYKVTGYRNIPALVLTTFTGTLKIFDADKIYDNDKTVGSSWYGYPGIEEFYYTVTNTNYEKGQYWYTKSKSAGTLGNGVGGGTAKTNKDAYFKDGEYTVKVKGDGWHGDTGEKTVKVLVDNFHPTVESTTPLKGATDMPVDTSIVINFDEKMDTASVESALSISPSVSGSKTWSDNGKTLTFNPSSDLEKGTTYTVAIGTGAEDVVGKGLDGDSDGDAGPEYSWSFTIFSDGTILQTISVSPSTVTRNVSETQQFTATAKDQSGNPMAGIDITWTSSNTAAGTVSPTSVTTGLDGKATTTFTASASGTTTVKAAHGAVSGTASVSVPNADSVGKIAFDSNRDGNWEIYVMNADGTNVKKLTSNSVTDGAPAWSPDGSKIAFQSDRDGDAEIYVMNADGTSVKKLTSNSALDWNPDWSPDGSQIVFVSTLDGIYSNNEIYVMNADGTDVKKLTSNSVADGAPAWSPDGSPIAFQSERDGDAEIYVMNADGTNVKKLTSNSASDEYPAWSPDGSKIAFCSERDGDYEIYVMNADGTNVKELTSSAKDDGLPVWSPGGNQIAFQSNRDGDYEIYVMNADGTNVKKLTSNSAEDWCPDWCCQNGKTTISIESASAPKGSTDTVPINISDVTNLCGANIWLNYDKNIVTVESVSDGNRGAITYNIDNDAGVTKMNWDTTEGETGSVVFAYVTLKAAGNSGDTSLFDLEVKDLYDCDLVDISHTVSDGIFNIGEPLSCFDTGESTNRYPSISGTHHGTLILDHTITVHKLYTYPCSGTGGHSEYVKIWNETWNGVDAYWKGYQEDGHTITFDSTFTLEAGTTYSYTIVTGSYPQIIHESSKAVTGGIIKCTDFVDTNGLSSNNWIPAIRLEGDIMAT